ncbi:tail fiber protein [Aliiglaciecola sp. CAU 1673]|uniref:phage tail protein n=1 Tax=Aliiglaciecola sp. CAU 1673 TaxID=3032595 RepID=UPI0023DA0832|nr:tail fiber protein [Aliiglaciecola sp. CAU 1673]MDF2178067.1 tail fiber protein [Aliiglaciecola sp. CAU 1673]
MSDPFVGEIRMFAGNFAPRGWAFCDGQLLAVSQNDALFSLFGTIYGGDGRTTFGLPDLRGRIPIHMGSGPGLTPRNIGSRGGAEHETLTANQIAAHNHSFSATSSAASDASPANNSIAASTGANLYGSNNPAAMNGASITPTGGSQSHTNLMPTLCIHFIVALVGIYPSRQ